MFGEVVFINEFVWDVGHVDMHILWTIHRCHEVEVLDIKTCKFCISTGEDAVDDQFDQVKGCRRGANVTWVAYSIASNCDPCLIGVVLLLSHETDNFGVRDFMSSVDWDIGIVNLR
jgi:hypothetical protein